MVGHGQSRGTGELRELAGQLADDLAERGLVLGDVERLAPLLVDRFRLNPARSARDEAGATEKDGLPRFSQRSRVAEASRRAFRGATVAPPDGGYAPKAGTARDGCGSCVAPREAPPADYSYGGEGARVGTAWNGCAGADTGNPRRELHHCAACAAPGRDKSRDGDKSNLAGSARIPDERGDDGGSG